MSAEELFLPPPPPEIMDWGIENLPPEELNFTHLKMTAEQLTRDLSAGRVGMEEVKNVVDQCDALFAQMSPQQLLHILSYALQRPLAYIDELYDNPAHVVTDSVRLKMMSDAKLMLRVHFGRDRVARYFHIRDRICHAARRRLREKVEGFLIERLSQADRKKRRFEDFESDVQELAGGPIFESYQFMILTSLDYHDRWIFDCMMRIRKKYHIRALPFISIT